MVPPSPLLSPRDVSFLTLPSLSSPRLLSSTPLPSPYSSFLPRLLELQEKQTKEALVRKNKPDARGQGLGQGAPSEFSPEVRSKLRRTPQAPGQGLDPQSMDSPDSPPRRKGNQKDQQQQQDQDQRQQQQRHGSNNTNNYNNNNNNNNNHHRKNGMSLVDEDEESDYNYHHHDHDQRYSHAPPLKPCTTV